MPSSNRAVKPKDSADSNNCAKVVEIAQHQSESAFSFKSPEPNGKWPLIRTRDQAESIVWQQFNFLETLQDFFPEYCHPDGSFTCPRCGGPLKVHALDDEDVSSPRWGQCLGTCQTDLDECVQKDSTKTKKNVRFRKTKHPGTLYVWDLFGIKFDWPQLRALAHLAAKLGFALDGSGSYVEVEGARGEVKYRWTHDLSKWKRQRQLIIHAIWYTHNGFSVFPCQSIVETPEGVRQCSCGKPDCGSPGKHPIPQNGVHAATDDISQILEWWSLWPTANIAISTGEKSGIFVLDIDCKGDKDGNASLEQLIKEYGPLPDTPMVATGSGGTHVYFRYPKGAQIGNSVEALGPGLDVRGDAGYVLAPPSNHVSGGNYEWEGAWHLSETDTAEAPLWLLDRASSRPSPTPSPARKERVRVPGDPVKEIVVPDGFPKGQRDSGLTSEIGRWIALGLTRSQIKLLALEVGRRCDPPFPEEEVLKKVESVFKTHKKKNSDWTEPPEPEEPETNDSAEKSCQEAIEIKCDSGPDEGLDDVITPPLTKAEECEALITKIADDSSCAVWEDHLTLMEWCQNDDPALWIAIKRELRKCHVLRDVEKELKKRKLTIVRGKAPRNPLKPALETLQIPCLPEMENLILPPAVTIDRDGIGILCSAPEGGMQRKEISPRLIFPVRIFRNRQSGGQQVDIVHLENANWKHVVIDRTSAVAGHKLIEAANLGLPVGAHDSKFLAQFLHNFILENENSLSIQEVQNTLGWLDSKKGESPAFLLPGGMVVAGDHSSSTEKPVEAGTTTTFRPLDAGDIQVAKALSACGNLNDWLFNVVFPLEPYPVARLLLYAGLCPPLLNILNAHNVGVDVSSRTSHGKTTLHRVAASVWGDPDRLVESWNTTLVGLERRCALMNDLPIFKDDSKTCNPKTVSDLIYSSINGCGRTRGSKTGTQSLNEWRTCLLSNGEAALTSLTSDAGAKARILSIRALPFGPATDQTRQLVDHLNLTAGQNYGHAGPRFVQWLIDHATRWEEFQRWFHDLARSYLGHVSGPGARLADSAAVIGLTSELVHECFTMPFDHYDVFTTGGLWDLIQAGISEIDVDIRALRDLYEFALSHSDRFWGHHIGDEGFLGVPNGGWLGIWERGDTWKYLAVVPLALRKFCEENSYDFDAVTSGWRERGWLQTDRGKNKLSSRKIQGHSASVYVIRREALDEIVLADS